MQKTQKSFINPFNVNIPSVPLLLPRASALQKPLPTLPPNMTSTVTSSTVLLTSF